jgi:hypothetical protein
MKARLFKLAVGLSAVAMLIQVVGADRKWG